MAAVCLSVDQCRNWEDAGKADFLRVCKNMHHTEKDSRSIAACGTKQDLKRAIYDLTWHVLKNNLKKDQAISALQDLVIAYPEVVSMFLDIIVVIDMETQMNLDNFQRDRFNQFVAECCGLIPERFIKERLDIDSLSDAGILKNKKIFYTKFIKTKTRLFYKQQKFNLLREESEGYAKLITELSQEFSSSISSAYLLEVIKALIGCFNLDPNRVLDVILESFECRPFLHSIFIPLIRAYMCNQNTLCEMLGFKFSFYQNSTDTETPESLYTIAALMIQHELIPLNGIYLRLKPPDADLVEEHKKEIHEAKTFARKMNVVTTTGDKGSDAKTPEENEAAINKLAINQKLGLCEALLRIGCWKHARATMSCMPDNFITAYPPIVRALCKLLHITIDPLYRKSCLISKILKSTPLPALPSSFAPQQVHTFAELTDSVFPMLCALGPQLHTDPILMVKIIRLAKACLTQSGQEPMETNQPPNKAQALKYNFITVLDEALLPSLSLLDGNCCMAEELWSVLKLYPYQQRYRLYGLWKNETYLNHPLLIRTKAEFVKKIKYIMKRLSKENVKPTGRHIGKLSHSNPGFLFEYILSQIQTWDNLIVPVVDSLKYLTNLSYDVLSYCVIEALANPEKVRMKHDGTTISLWLQGLSSFCGAVYKKYSIELTGLLQYVANQLKAEKSLDLLILKEIVQKMAGIETIEEMTNDQLEAMAGGELLRAEGGYFSQIRNTKKSSQRLKEALVEQDLVVPLCLLMAQQRNCIIYKEEENSHLKLVGKLYDQCQDTLVQFGNFLASSLSMEDYIRRLPPLSDLMGEYRIMADVAFFLSRPMFSHAIQLKFDEMRRQDKSYRSASDADKMQKFLNVVELVMSPAVDSVRLLYSPRVWEDISPQFFVTFWSLSMYDLHVPSSTYEKEVNKLKLQITQINDNVDLIQSKKKKEVDRCKTLKDKLQEEEKKQRDHCERVMARLQMEKDTWFLSRSAKNETITQFLQLCVFPRCIFTAVDAIYCAKFVHTIHNLKTPNFSTLICYDRIFCDITYTVTSCTENEANRYGRFLCAMLETVMRWHSNKSIFEKECADYPGFVTKFRVANQQQETACDHVDYENYRHVCHKWHYKITKALVICLESGDYVQIRNSLIVLTKILPYYPMITNLGQVIEKRIENVRTEEKEKRPDLYVLAVGYSGQLKSKKPSMLPEQEFHQREGKEVVGLRVKTHASQNGVKAEPHNKPVAAPAAAPAAEVKSEKTKENSVSREAKDKEKRVVSKAEIKTEQKTVKVNAESQKSATNNSSSAPAGILKDPNRSKTAAVPKETEKDSTGGEKEMEKVRISLDKQTSRIKEERTAEDTHHAHREKRGPSKDRESKLHSRTESEKERKAEKVEREPSVTSTGSGSSHGQRRSVDPPEPEKETKRRKVEAPSIAPGKSPHHEERPREKKKDEDHSSSQERKVREKADKSREGKGKDRVERKRDRTDDKEACSPSETKKRKEEDMGKSLGRQNGESEIRERERHKRDENEEKKPRSRELREEKKHHRTVAVSGKNSTFGSSSKR